MVDQPFDEGKVLAVVQVVVADADNFTYFIQIRGP